MWLTSEVANAVGLAPDRWDGQLYHFHPIHWVMWVTYHATTRNRTYYTPTSLRALIVRQRRAKGFVSWWIRVEMRILRGALKLGENGSDSATVR